IIAAPEVGPGGAEVSHLGRQLRLMLPRGAVRQRQLRRARAERPVIRPDVLQPRPPQRAAKAEVVVRDEERVRPGYAVVRVVVGEVVPQQARGEAMMPSG